MTLVMTESLLLDRNRWCGPPDTSTTKILLCSRCSSSSDDNLAKALLSITDIQLCSKYKHSRLCNPLKVSFLTIEILFCLRYRSWSTESSSNDLLTTREIMLFSRYSLASDLSPVKIPQFITEMLLLARESHQRPSSSANDLVSIEEIQLFHRSSPLCGCLVYDPLLMWGILLLLR